MTQKPSSIYIATAEKQLELYESNGNPRHLYAASANLDTAQGLGADVFLVRKRLERYIEDLEETNLEEFAQS